MIGGGHDFLTSFPNAEQRTEVALLMADAYARTGKTQEEFAIYDSVLQELAAKAQKVPLGQSASGAGSTTEMSMTETADSGLDNPDSADGESGFRRSGSEAFQVGGAPVAVQTWGAVAGIFTGAGTIPGSAGSVEANSGSAGGAAPRD